MSVADVDSVILGAGGSARMDGVDKLLEDLGGIPLIAWSLRAFAAAPSIRQIVLTASGANREVVEAIAAAANLSKAVAVVLGGSSRAHSVLNALESAAAAAPYTAIHDGARPFVSVDIIERGAATAREVGAAVAAVPSSDTVKIVGTGGLIVDTPPRPQVWLAQTPQIGRTEDLCRAHEAGRDRLASFTDDVSVLAAVGIPAHVYESDPGNFKITTADDLARARQRVMAGLRPT